MTLIRIRKNSKNDDISSLQKMNILTWGISFILMGFIILMFMMWYYIITNEAVAAIINIVFVFIFHITILIRIFDTEYTINKHGIYRGYYFSLIIICLAVFALIVPLSTIRATPIYQYIYVILFVSGVSIYFFCFVYVAMKTKGKERSYAIRLGLFPIIMIIGVSLMPYNVEVYYQPMIHYPILSIIPQIMMSSGIILMYSTYSKNLK